MLRNLEAAAACGGVALFAVLATAPTEAHKGITSKYNYNEHVFPILRDRCGSCHFAGGPAPMSLVNYLEAAPWAESIREQLVAQKMPPWSADPLGPAVRGGHQISATELDILLSWAAGGTPRADEKTFVFGSIQGVTSPTFDGPPAEWTLGPPDLLVSMDAPYTVPAGKVEDEQTFVLPTGVTKPTWIKAVDLLPGTRSMVRDALISTDDGQVLAAWVPGHEMIAAPSGAAFRLVTGAKLQLRIHYRKNWQDEQADKSDRSTIGLYVTQAPLSGKPIAAAVVESPGPSDSQGGRILVATLEGPARVVALRPSVDRPYRSLAIEAHIDGGRRIPLLRLRSAQPQWYRRYWLREPIELPAGATIEMKALPAPPDAFSVPITKQYPLKVDIDYVAP
jgi:hypothetical protein